MEQHVIKKEYQLAIYIIKNCSMLKFKEWLAKYLKMEIMFIDDAVIFFWLKTIYVDVMDDSRNILDTLWLYIKSAIAHDGDTLNVVINLGIEVLWNILENCEVEHNGEYVNGFTKDVIGSLPGYFPDSVSDYIIKELT